MKKVFLHVGHMKTGSSAIQSFLALNDARLKSFGISYPEHQSFDHARRGGITTGNYYNEEKFDDQIINRSSDQKENTVLFSSEILFRAVLNRPECIEKIRSCFDLTIIIFVRDPLDFFASHYSEALKRGGYHDEFSAFVEEYKQPEMILQFLELTRDRGWKTEIINFSRHRADIITPLLDKLGLDGDGWALPSQPVNRSLSVEEMHIARAFNRELGRTSSRYISDPFCEEIPRYRGTAISVPADIAARFVEKNEDYIVKIDDLLPEGEKYSPTWRSDAIGPVPDPGDQLVITKQHIDVLAASIKKQFTRLEKDRVRRRRRVKRRVKAVGDGQEGSNGPHPQGAEGASAVTQGDVRAEETELALERLRQENLRLGEKVSRLRARIGKPKRRGGGRKTGRGLQ